MKYQEILNESFMTILQHKQYLYDINNKLENNILYPIDINRICKNKCLQKEPCKSNVSPLYILEENNKLKDKLFVSVTFKNNKIIEILIDIHLNPKILITQFNILKEVLLISTFKFGFCLSLSLHFPLSNSFIWISIYL